jgi:hypothetical protein
MIHVRNYILEEHPFLNLQMTFMNVKDVEGFQELEKTIKREEYKREWNLKKLENENSENRF